MPLGTSADYRKAVAGNGFGEIPQRLDGDGNHGFIVILLVLLASLLAREEQGGYEE